MEEHIQSIQKLCSGKRFNWFEIFEHLEQIKEHSPSVYKLIFADVLSQAAQKDQMLGYVQYMNRAEVGVDPDSLKISVCGVEMASRFTGGIQPNDDGTATVTLKNIPIHRIKPEYKPIPTARCRKTSQHSYTFLIEGKDPAQNKAFYCQWFRSFFEHHVMQNQPSEIPWEDEVEINPRHYRLSIYLDQNSKHHWHFASTIQDPEIEIPGSMMGMFIL